MENKVINADSFEYLQTFEDNSVDLIITDPPYDFSNEQKHFLHNHFIRISKSWVIVFSPPENQWILPADQYLFWMKPPSTKNTSKSYSRFVEMIFVYGYGVWNYKKSRHWSQFTNIFKDLVDDSSLHPYRKPPSLIERLILNHSNPGDLILDPFSGSGVVAAVAKRNKRNFIAIEKDKNYFYDSQLAVGMADF